MAFRTGLDEMKSPNGNTSYMFKILNYLADLPKNWCERTAWYLLEHWIRLVSSLEQPTVDIAPRWRLTRISKITAGRLNHV